MSAEGAGPALDVGTIAGLDPQGMLGDVLAQPGQLADAAWRCESAGIPSQALDGGLLVCGMGGSAIGADLARAAIGGRATAPIASNRGYRLPSWVGRGTLVLCASYSGETEETLACFAEAGQVGAPRVVLTTGGALAEAARAEGVPVIGVPAGMQPRAAVVYMVSGALECAARCAAAPSLREELEGARELLESLVAEWGPDAGEDSRAKALARALAPSVPVVYGAETTAAAAMRWKTQVNENAEAPAFWAELPEATHNEVCSWAPGGPLHAVFLEDAGQHPRVQRRIEVAAAQAAGDGLAVERVESRGETAVERVLSLVLLGDLISVYLAALRGVDPTPVAAIDRFKESLGP